MSEPATPHVQEANSQRKPKSPPILANTSVPPPGSATPAAVVPQASSTPPTLPSPASFDILPDLHKLLSRLIQTSGQPSDAAAQPDQPSTDAPLDVQHLATAATEVKLKIQRARRTVLALPDIHRTCEDQQDEIEDLEARILKLKGVLQGLGRSRSGDGDTDINMTG